MRQSFEEFLKSLSPEKILEINKKVLENTDKEYLEFKETFEKGICYLCNKRLESFEEKIPCIHWLLNPHGFEKKHFPQIFMNFEYSRIDPYLKWVANLERPIKNINNLKEEKNTSMIIEYSIKYKNLEWSFSCKESDLTGHQGGKFGVIPHYHFQMRINGKPFINYSDYHIPLSEFDIAMVKAKGGRMEKVISTNIYDAGMQDIADLLSPEEMLEAMSKAEKESDSAYHLQTFVSAEGDNKISGTDLAKLIKEHNETNVPLATLVKKLKNVKVTTVIEPGEGVPNIAGRTPRKKGKKKSNKNIDS